MHVYFRDTIYSMNNCNNTNVNKATFDPGWNDPPNLSYSPQNVTPNRPRNFLNKRVAFPLTGSIQSPAPPPPVNLPPMPVASAPPIHSNPKIAENSEDINIDSESTLIEVKDILFELLKSSSELGAKANDIQRRISVMEEMWISGKLNKRIQVQMKELTNALKDNEPSKADDIHRAMMVDHVSAVGTWMPGIKQLIHHCIARWELLAIDKE